MRYAGNSQTGFKHSKGRSPPTSGPTARPDRLPVEKMRPGSIVVSGNKKRRSAHTKTRRHGPDILGMNMFIPRRTSGERGDSSIGFSYTSCSPFTASCLLIVIMQSQELDFYKSLYCLTIRLTWRYGWHSRRKNVGSGLTVGPDASGVLA